MGVWKPSSRVVRINPSALREILHVTERPGMLSLAGGLPLADLFPARALREASDRILSTQPAAALQYGPSEGLAPLREWVARHMSQWGPTVKSSQVLITTGSQQGLDLLAKVLLDPGAAVAVESPTYLGALQAFAMFAPRWVSVPTDDEGPLPEGMHALGGEDEARSRCLYLVPSFHNPTGRVMPAARRRDVVWAAQHAGVPLIEDNPYGELWFDTPPPAPLWAQWPEGVVYLGSFSKVVAPGLRVGWMVAPPALHRHLLVAKQASDLHTPSFNQHLVLDLVRSGWLDRALSPVRDRYRQQRDAMQAALLRHLPAGCDWRLPVGGMFFWVRLPQGSDAQALFERAVGDGVAFVPGAAFAAGPTDDLRRWMRLSFVTLTPGQIEDAVARLGRAASAVVTPDRSDRNAV